MSVLSLSILCFLWLVTNGLKLKSFTSRPRTINKSEGSLSLQSTSMSEDNIDDDVYTSPLIRDTKLLSTILGDIVRRESAQVFEVRTDVWY